MSSKCSGRNQADIEIGEADGEEADPREEHVAFVQKLKPTPGSVACGAEGGARKTVELSAGQVAQRVAGESVEGEQGDVDEQNERADADAKSVRGEEESLDGVMPKKREKNDGEIKEVAMEILQNEREMRFAACNCACGFSATAQPGGSRKNAR